MAAWKVHCLDRTALADDGLQRCATAADRHWWASSGIHVRHRMQSGMWSTAFLHRRHLLTNGRRTHSTSFLLPFVFL